MSRSLDAAPALPPLTRSWLGAALALTLAIGVALLVCRLLIAPPAGDLRALAAYLTLSGAGTLGAGWLALRVADHAAGATIRTKVFLSGVTGSAVGLLNIFIVAQLMFLSTAHDLKLLVALLLFSAVVTIFFSLWVAATIATRLQVIAAGIGSLAAGGYDTQLMVPGRDEVAHLARDVNGLAQRLQAAEERRAALERERRELTAAISHDLRTPLASMRAMVEALDDRVVEDAAEVERYYGMMRREIERLSRMIDDLFELAQIDAGALRLNKQPVALQEIAAEVVDAMQAQARRDGVALELRIQGALPEIPLDGARIERAVANLVRNALAHTAAGGRVAVDVAAAGDWVELRVSDNGEGIEDADLPRIWDRFYRAERSRQRGPKADDGAGLGLAIVRGIVETHGGAVAVRSSPGQGATFTVRLPQPGSP